MAYRIAIANHKGGVGKSTTTMMVAEGLALFAGLRVLVIDFDPQSSTSRMLLSSAGVQNAERQFRTISEVLDGVAAGKPTPLSRFVTARASDIIELRDARDNRRVDLISSTSALLNRIVDVEAALRARFAGDLDVALAAALRPELDRVDLSYDAIVFDCAAGTGATSLAAIRLSNYIIAPSVLDAVSIDALRDFIKIILAQRIDAAGHITLKVLPTIFRSGDPVQRQMLDAIRANAALKSFERAIPDSVNLRRAVERIRPDSYRSAREKYAGTLGDVQWLSEAVMKFVESSEGSR